MDNNWIIDNLNYAFTLWNDELTEMWSLLTQSPQAFKGGTIWQTIQTVNGAMQGVGYGLLVLFFAVCAGIISAAAGSVGGIEGAALALPGEIVTAIEGVGFLASIPLWLVTLLGCLLITVLAFLMILTVYARFFKLYLYAALSPVALASFAGEGTSQMGRAFLKSYVGVCLEGAVIVLACIVYSAFASSGTTALGGGSAVTQVWSYLGEVIFNMLVLVGLVKGADRVVREMFGL